MSEMRSYSGQHTHGAMHGTHMGLLSLLDWAFPFPGAAMWGGGWERQAYVLAAFAPVALLPLWPLLGLLWMAWVGFFVFRHWLAPAHLQPTPEILVLVTGCTLSKLKLWSHHRKRIKLKGCDSPLGQATALELDLKGAAVFAAFRDPGSLHAEELAAQASPRLRRLQLGSGAAAAAQALAAVQEHVEEHHLRGSLTSQGYDKMGWND